ncbi:MAG: hypothetical protein ABGZ17_04230 [Planctomycetaceae bacterium]
MVIQKSEDECIQASRFGPNRFRLDIPVKNLWSDAQRGVDQILLDRTETTGGSPPLATA